MKSIRVPRNLEFNANKSYKKCHVIEIILRNMKEICSFLTSFPVGRKFPAL
jgi:hypothetical protein